MKHKDSSPARDLESIYALQMPFPTARSPSGLWIPVTSPFPYPDTLRVALEPSLACRPLGGPASIPLLALVPGCHGFLTLLRGHRGWLALVAWTNWDQNTSLAPVLLLNSPLCSSPGDFSLENPPQFSKRPYSYQNGIAGSSFEKRSGTMASSSQLGS